MILQKTLGKIAGKKFTIKVLKKLSFYSRRWSNKMHKAQMEFEWSTPPEPASFDHYCDLHHNWPETNVSFWVERGVFSLLAMKEKANVLELCCGDGFNTKHFFSARAGHIIAVDFDPECIAHARQYNWAHNVKYDLCDIRYNIPEGKFDNVIFDAALAYFTEEETDQIMKTIKQRLGDTGILSGSSIVETGKGKSLGHHIYEFKSKEDLKRFFDPHFKNVTVFETRHPGRHNLYFFASNDILPFDNEWGDMIRKHA